MNQFETVIFAAGDGNRMKSVTDMYNAPKPLLPFRDETPISRLVRQLSPYSNSIMCCVKPGQTMQYYDELESHEKTRNCTVHIHELTGEKKESLYEIHELLRDIPEDAQILYTQGDLVFRDVELKNFFKNPRLQSKTHIVFDFHHGLPIRFVITPKKLLTLLHDKPLSLDGPVTVGMYIMRNLFKQVLTRGLRIHDIRTLANLNEPKDYHAVRRFTEIG